MATGGRLAGKTVVTTAAAQGIGRECSVAFAREGAKVIATDLEAQTEKLKALETEFPGRIETHVVDVTKRELIKSLAAKVEKCDVLFNCAGIVFTDNVLTISDSHYEAAMNVNLRGMLWMIQEFLPKMVAQKKGSIINMSSVCSSIMGVPNRSSYGITKAAVIGLTKSIAADFIKDGIRCNCICPGTVETESWRERVNTATDPEKAKKDFIARQPLGRIGQPHEVASVVVHLASDESSYTTGSEVVVDGGWSNVHSN